jgi:Cupin
MDALSDVLRVAHLTGGVFLHAEFSEPWCMAARVPPEQCAPALGPASHLIIYHYIVEGHLRIRVEGEDGEDIVIGAGELVLLPRNDMHLMGSDLSLPPVAGSDIIHPPKDGGLYSIHHGGVGRRTRKICGFLGCDSAEGNPVISTLPPLLKLNVEQSGAGEWIRSTFRYAADEIAAGRPGSETVLAKLSELLFVEAVRRYAEVLPDGQTGWLAGLREPYVVAVGVGRTIHSFDRGAADALPRQLAHAGRHSEAPQHQRIAGANCRDCRLRIRGGILPRVQEGVQCGAGHMAALPQLGKACPISQAPLSRA